jgi:hypothetical protein
MAAVQSWPWPAISASELKECNYIHLPLRSEFTMASEGCTYFIPTSDFEPPGESSSPQNGLAAKTYY